MTVGIAKNFGASVAAAGLVAFITPNPSASNTPPGSATSPLTTCNVNGGTPPYTFLWSKVSGDDISISSTTDQSVTFSASGSNGEIKTATYKCVVTDDVAANAEDTVLVRFIFGDV